MKTMRRFWLLLCCSGTLLCGAELTGVHAVYFMPMARGLDQYLANRLTNEHVFQVVTDPKLADAVFTDRIGDAFQAQMESLFPPPAPATAPPATAPPATAPASPAAAKKDSKEPKQEEPNAAVLPTDTVNKLSNPALNSSFGRGKGTVFLVEAKSHLVVWSTYSPSKGTSGNEMDRTASDIVSRLKKDLNPGKK